MTARIRFEPDGVEVEVPVGTTLKAAAEQGGVHLGSACGGVCAWPHSRLGCQTHVLKARLYVVEISRESRDAFFDEHPDLRPKG
jgi:uncharacterized 2Fe-2S/4Fe-4S cluster protein (DUF4445 family)